MPFIVYFYIYSGAALLVFVIALCWGNDQKINAATLLLGSIILTNIFQQLVVLDAITTQMLNLIYALIDLMLLWVFVGIARRPAAFERNNWAIILVGVQLCMLCVNLLVSYYTSLTRAYFFMVFLNGLMIIALVTCFISFMPKSWNEATGVLKVKWLYFKADILDRLFRAAKKKTMLSADAGEQAPTAGALHAKIGARIHNARLKRGLEPDDLGDFLGVSASEARAYEAGDKRLSATALHALSKHLGTKLRVFYDGLALEGPALRRPTRAVGN